MRARDILGWACVCGGLGAGCGRLGFEAQPAVDAVTAGDGGPADAAVDAPTTCTGPWGAAVPLTQLNTDLDDWGPFLRDDGLEIFFSRVDATTGLFVATRTDLTSLWIERELTELNVLGGSVDNPVLAPDELTLYFDVGVVPHRATRADRTSAFTGVEALSSLGEGVGLALASDGALWLSSDRSGTLGALDLYRAAPNGPNWAAPVNLGAPINSPAFDCCATFTPDGAVLFPSQRSLPAGETQLLLATPGGGGAFTVAPFPLTASLAPNVFDPSMTRDGRFLVVAARTIAESSEMHLYERACD